MRKKIVAGNWKMHKNATQTAELLNELKTQVASEDTKEVIL